MKILFLITGLGLGGAERVVTQLADEMHVMGHEVTIAYLTGEKINQPKSNNIPVICLHLDSFKDLLSAFKNYNKLINEYRPDVVHAHMFHAILFSRLSRIFKPVPKLICTAHSSHTGSLFRRLAYRFTHNLSDILTNVSEEASHSFIKHNICKANGIHTVYNGIDLNKFQNLNINRKAYQIDFNLLDSTKVILSVGRFHELKDYPNLLRAVSDLSKHRTDFKLLIAGDGDLRPKIESLIDSLKINNFVLLLGNRSDIPELMSFSDIFVLSSKREGLPTVLIEAMACKKLIVATDCGGSKEILGNTGILVPPNDSSKLYNALVSALSYTPKDLEANGLKARDRVNKLFSLERSVNQWLDIYKAN